MSWEDITQNVLGLLGGDISSSPPPIRGNNRPTYVTKTTAEYNSADTQFGQNSGHDSRVDV